MTRYLRNSFDLLLLVLALATTAVSCAWTWRQQLVVRRIRTQSVTALLGNSRWEPAGARPAGVLSPTWGPPAAQSRGGGWRFELFTPPAVCYDPATRDFALAEDRLHATKDASFALELLEVKRTPYRLQLAGYFGGPGGDYRAALAWADEPGILLARAGDRLGQGGLILKAFGVKQVLTESNEAGPVYDLAAFATVRDEATGAEVELDSRVRKLTEKVVAVCRLTGTAVRMCELSAGDEVSEGPSTYRVQRLALSPPELEVVRLTRGEPRAETELLHPTLKVLRPTATGEIATAARGAVHPPKKYSSNDN